MGFFNKILEKLGIKKETPPAAPTASQSRSKPSGTTTSPAGKAAWDEIKEKGAQAQAKSNPIVAPVAMAEVDVVKKLETLAAGSGLNWKVSIVDLLKLLDIDSSREARNELAVELGCPAELMSDSAKMNVWLHKTVLKKIAENGGNIPQALLD